MSLSGAVWYCRGTACRAPTGMVLRYSLIMPMNFISSPNNPRIKEIVRLRDASYRKEKGLFIIEGLREVQLALRAGFKAREIYLCPEFLDTRQKADFDFKARDTEIIELDRKAYEKMAFGERKEGVIAVAKDSGIGLKDIKIKPKSLIMVLEGLEKPGNLGAIARCADAAGVRVLIAADTKVDIYNPNAIRSSLGAIFSVKTLKESSVKVIAWLKANNIKIVSAIVSADMDYTQVDFNQSLAIVLGSEEKGLSRIWRDNSDYQVSLPMAGEADSLNVAVTGGILLYEALRQRR